MALAEVCGMQNFDAFKHPNMLVDNITNYTTNFNNNMSLAHMPLTNVSNNYFSNNFIAMIALRATTYYRNLQRTKPVAILR